jgi:hypothetical protein
MKWFYAQTMFIPLILSQLKDKMTDTTNIKMSMKKHTNNEVTLDVDYYETLFRS